MSKSLFILLIIGMLSACAVVDSMILNVYSKECRHGLLKPAKGDFSIFVFCDDALGTQIGVVLDRKGVGPVESGGKWSANQRFWQEGMAMADVKQIVWSNSGNYAYITTSEVYSDNSLYELCLINRTITMLFDGELESVDVSIDAVEGNALSVNGHIFQIKE